MVSETSLVAILKNNGYSITKPRQLVFQALAKHQPISLVKLCQVVEPKIDKASVYRTIELFQQLGITQRVWLGFKSHYELSEAFSAHHHHLTCLSCGSVIAVEDRNLENNLAGIAERFGFAAQSHLVEIAGACLNCQQKPAKP